MTRLIARLHGAKRWLYRDDRPNSVAKFLNRFWGGRYRAGSWLSRARDVELEVAGRSTGRPIAFPIVLADVEGDVYAVSMLGANANWVRNVRAADGLATVRHGGSWSVHLSEIPAGQRAAILRRYVQVAPGARPHVPVDRNAPISDFEAIAANYPIFRVEGFALS